MSHQVPASAANRSISSAAAVLAPDCLAAASAIGGIARFGDAPGVVDKC
jgi:hypothetical protein